MCWSSSYIPASVVGGASVWRGQPPTHRQSATRTSSAPARALISAGVLMLLQPFALALYTYSFATTLAGVALFIVVSKFPD